MAKKKLVWGPIWPQLAQIRGANFVYVHGIIRGRFLPHPAPRPLKIFCSSIQTCPFKIILRKNCPTKSNPDFV